MQAQPHHIAGLYGARFRGKKQIWFGYRLVAGRLRKIQTTSREVIKMAITDIRVVQIWDIDQNGQQKPVTHYFEVQRNNEDTWEQLELVNVLRSDHRQKEVQEENIQGTA